MVKNWEAALNLTRDRTASSSSTAGLANIIRSVHQQAVTQRFAQVIDRISTLMVTIRRGATMVFLHWGGHFLRIPFIGRKPSEPADFLGSTQAKK